MEKRKTDPKLGLYIYNIIFASGKTHQEIADAIQQNSYLQREITAAREVYNDTVATWNREIFSWPTKMIVAARSGYTTRIPFTASKEMKSKARDVFF